MANMTFGVNLIPKNSNNTQQTLGNSENKWDIYAEDLVVDNINGKTPITGVKGNAETNYRTGNINLTPENIGAIATSAKGAASGVAELDSNGKVPSSQLPSYVDDVLEYAQSSSFPTTGETGKIYIAQDTNKTYRWSGTTYVEISASLALGTTSSTAYRGDYGNAAYTHAVTNKGSAFSSGLYKITTNSEGHVTGATAVAKSDITGLGIPENDTHRVVQVNGTQALGNNTIVLNLKAGSNISITDGGSGEITIAATDTTYSAGTGLSLSGTTFSNSGVTSINNQTGAVSITSANIGAVTKTGDTMTGQLGIDVSAQTDQGRILFTSPGISGPCQIVAVTRGTQQNIGFRHFIPDGMSYEEYDLPNSADYIGEPVIRNILTDKSPVLVIQGGTSATTWDGARENLGVIARVENVPFDSNGWGTLNTPNGFTPFAAVLDQNWFITVHPPNKIMARQESDYNVLIRDTTSDINVLYVKLA